MARHCNFLVIDDNGDSRFLLVKTLLRKFPHAVIHECQDVEAATSKAAGTELDAIVTHRAVEVDGVMLVSLLRKANPIVPIVMVSAINRSQEALAAGATRFLIYDEWLRIGTLMAEVLWSPPPSPGPESAPADPGASGPAPVVGA